MPMSLVPASIAPRVRAFLEQAIPRVGESAAEWNSAFLVDITVGVQIAAGGLY
jgi:hypothetical protein